MLSRTLDAVIDGTVCNPFRRLHILAATRYATGEEKPFLYDVREGFSRMRNESGWAGFAGLHTNLDVDVIDAICHHEVRKISRRMLRNNPIQGLAWKLGREIGVEIHDFALDQCVHAIFYPLTTVVDTMFHIDHRRQLFSSGISVFAMAAAMRSVVHAHGVRGLWFGFGDTVLYNIANKVLHKVMAPAEHILYDSVRQTPLGSGFLWNVIVSNIAIFIRIFLLECLVVWKQVRLVNRLMPAICAANPGKGVVAPVTPVTGVPMFALRGVWAGARLRMLMRIVRDTVAMIADRIVLDRLRRQHM